MPKAVPEWTGDLKSLSNFKFNVVVFGKTYTNCSFVHYDVESKMLSFISAHKRTLCVPALQCEILITNYLGTSDKSIEDVVTSDKGGKSKKRSRVAEEVIDEEDDFEDDDFEDDDFGEPEPETKPKKKKNPAKKAPTKKRRRKS